MKNIFYLLLVFALSANAQIPNNGFEDMNSDSTIQFWSGCSYNVTLTDSIISDGKFLSLSTNSHTGEYALELRNSWNFTQNYGYPGCAAITSEISGQPSFINNFELSIKPEFIEFHYLFTSLEANDTSICLIHVMDTNYVEIGLGVFKMFEKFDNYSLAQVPISYTENYFSRVLINIQFKNKTDFSNASLGTRLLIDDLSITSSAEIVEKNYSENHIEIFPNPSNSIFQIKTNEKLQFIEIYDWQGQLIHTKTNSLNEIDLSNYSEGLYFLKVVGKENNFLTKIVKV